MAFNKKPLKAQDELIPYSVDLENRIASGFDDVHEQIDVTVHQINNLLNGWEGFLKIVKQGVMVHLSGRLTKVGTVSNRTIIATVPATLRPTRNTSIIVTKTNTPPYDSSIWFWLQAGGQIVIQTTDSIVMAGSHAVDINVAYSIV